MTTTAPTRRPSAATRRVGYFIAAALTAALFYLLNVEPGWADIPFLTGDTDQVLGLVNLSLAASILANLVYLVSDTPWLKALGGLVTTGIGLVALVRIWQVFPFDLAGSSFDWELLLRIVLVVGIVGSAIGVLVQVVTLLRGGRSPGR